MVDREGNFSLNSDPRILYSTMLKTRCQIINGCPMNMLAALTIVLRYSIVRRQFRNTDGTEEET